LAWERNKIISTLENSDKRVIVLAVYDVIPVGFAAAEVCGKVWMEQDELYYALNYAAPPYRRRGIANGLSSFIADYGKSLGMRRIVSEPVTVAGKNRAERGGFTLISAEEYFGEEPGKVIKGKGGIDSYVYYIDELPLAVPDHIAVMNL
jgi:GNAT superfamily N-acetyltransferase